MSSDGPASTVRLFYALSNDVVEPYRNERNLEWYELPFTIRLEKKFLIGNGVQKGSRTVISIDCPFNPSDVMIFDDKYKDLGEQLREKLAELKEAKND